jgi:hypothetical protein
MEDVKDAVREHDRLAFGAGTPDQLFRLTSGH